MEKRVVRHSGLCHRADVSGTSRGRGKTVRFERLTLPRCRGSSGSMRRYCSCVIQSSGLFSAVVRGWRGGGSLRGDRDAAWAGGREPDGAGLRRPLDQSEATRPAPRQDCHYVNSATQRRRATPSLYAQGRKESKRTLKRRLTNAGESSDSIEAGYFYVVKATAAALRVSGTIQKIIFPIWNRIGRQRDRLSRQDLHPPVSKRIPGPWTEPSPCFDL